MEPANDEAGWYEVQVRLSASELEFISEGNLTYGSGEHALAFDVLEVAVDDEQVRVRASAAAPRERLSLYIRRTDTRRMLKGLGNGLKAAQENPLLRQFGERRLTPVQPGLDLADVHAWPVLRDAQKQAVRACCSAGLQLVWGPPGTGKTFVIAAAISHLVASGQRVLLVSNNNIAVDTALYEALSILRTTGEGQAIRVGNIGLPALVSDRRVRLDRLVEARQAQQRARVDGLATMDGTRFADEILQQELAAELGQRRQCQACGQDLLECGLVGSGNDRGWAWICTANRGHRLKFPRSDAYGSQRRNYGRRS